MYLLATVVVSELPKKKRNRKVVELLASQRPEELVVSEILLGEICRGTFPAKTQKS